MNYVQWMFMAQAFRRREEEQAKLQSEVITDVFKASARALRELLVHLFGLHLGAGKVKEGEPTPYHPLITLLGRGELIEELLQRDKEEEQVDQAVVDTNADDMFERIMQLEEGDLEPIFSGIHSNDPMERWMSPENQEALKHAGVELHDESTGFITSLDTKNNE